MRAAAEEEEATQAERLRVTIARAQADSLSAYVSEERRLSDQRRGELAVRERELSEKMAEVLAAVEQRVEERLRAWESDLERAQNALQGSVATLEQRMRQRISEVEARVASESDELDATIDEQRAAAVRLRLCDGSLRCRLRVRGRGQGQRQDQRGEQKEDAELSGHCLPLHGVKTRDYTH